MQGASGIRVGLREHDVVDQIGIDPDRATTALITVVAS
jgi:hypothetical protein